MLRSLDQWARREAARTPELLKLGYFGSFARGDWGVGSDLDLVAVVSTCEPPFERRALAFRTEELPVPTEILVYTLAEWNALLAEGGRTGRTLDRETIWLDLK